MASSPVQRIYCRPHFGQVQVSAVSSSDRPKWFLVTYSQGYSKTGSQLSFAKRAVGVYGKSNDAVRTFSEYWTLEELGSANNGEGLRIEDAIPGVCISVLNSLTPFYSGQRPYHPTGRYYKTFLEEKEDEQPNDRTVEAALS